MNCGADNDILRALDYFQAVNAPRDPRLAEAFDRFSLFQTNPFQELGKSGISTKPIQLGIDFCTA